MIGLVCIGEFVFIFLKAGKRVLVLTSKGGIYVAAFQGVFQLCFFSQRVAWEVLHRSTALPPVFDKEVQVHLLVSSLRCRVAAGVASFS